MSLQDVIELFQGVISTNLAGVLVDFGTVITGIFSVIFIVFGLGYIIEIMFKYKKSNRGIGSDDVREDHAERGL